MGFNYIIFNSQYSIKKKKKSMLSGKSLSLSLILSLLENILFFQWGFKLYRVTISTSIYFEQTNLYIKTESWPSYSLCHFVSLSLTLSPCLLPLWLCLFVSLYLCISSLLSLSISFCLSLPLCLSLFLSVSLCLFVSLWGGERWVRELKWYRHSYRIQILRWSGFKRSVRI